MLGCCHVRVMPCYTPRSLQKREAAFFKKNGKHDAENAPLWRHVRRGALSAVFARLVSIKGDFEIAIMQAAWGVGDRVAVRVRARARATVAVGGRVAVRVRVKTSRNSLSSASALVTASPSPFLRASLAAWFAC